MFTYLWRMTLAGGRSTSGTKVWTLTDVVWDTATNHVSGKVVLSRASAMTVSVAPTFQIGTYDHTQIPFTINKQSLTITPASNSTGQELTWTFTNVQMPTGEKFAGVYVSGGSYVIGLNPTDFNLTLICAHDQW